MKRLTDTSPEAERVLRESYRRMPFERKWRQMAVIYRTARALHAAGVRQRNPSATAADIASDWRAVALGGLPYPEWKGAAVEEDKDNVAIVEEVIAVLGRLNIPYAVGGSWASSLLGKMRFTHDADLTVEPFLGRGAGVGWSVGGLC